MMIRRVISYHRARKYVSTLLGPLVNTRMGYKTLSLLLKLVLPDRFVQIEIRELKFLINPFRMPQWYSYLWSRKLPEENILLTFRQFCKDSLIVFDLGAHWGLYALVASREIRPEGKVIALEPSSQNYRILLKNIQINGSRNIFPLQAAVGREAGEEKLYLGEDLNLGSFYLAGRGKNLSPRYEVVKVEKFDTLARGYERIDVLKVDIEGAEGLFLEGAKKSLKEGKVKSIFLELHPAQLIKFGYQHKQILEQLKFYNFRLYHLNEYENKYKELVGDKLNPRRISHLLAILKGSYWEDRL